MEVRLEEKGRREPLLAVCVEDAMGGRAVHPVGPPLQHVPEVDDEGVRTRRDVKPGALFRLDLQARVRVGGEEGEHAIVRVLSTRQGPAPLPIQLRALFGVAQKAQEEHRVREIRVEEVGVEVQGECDEPQKTPPDALHFGRVLLHSRPPVREGRPDVRAVQRDLSQRVPCRDLRPDVVPFFGIAACLLSRVQLLLPHRRPSAVVGVGEAVERQLVLAWKREKPTMSV
eukprot:CAMPEP_0180187548 /NCGR_PEP_ID=MMETSP0986-20121125/43603_1 /TAXON_ID=697907 /ORGANISM="non described non described, Strain CCMP2293" /LENGTH=227 /DNA_ID=CAMNT_0022141681 /DNA_START=433 /DNA_END=1117 /DNA_ORIENTATION=+